MSETEAIQIHSTTYLNLLSAYRQLFIAQLKCLCELTSESESPEAKHRTRTEQAPPPASQPTTAETTASQSPDAGSRRRNGGDFPEFFTLGTRKADVSRIQGAPKSTSTGEDLGYEGENWNYGDGELSSVVSFNKSGRVEGWYNRGNLKVRIVPGPNITTSPSLTIGSHKDDVVRLQGTPFRVSAPFRRTRTAIREERRLNRELGIKPDEEGKDGESDRQTWYFRGGTVEFSFSTGRVTSFDNKDGSLKVQRRWPERDIEWTGDDFFTLRSTQREVKRVQGEPISKSKMPLGTEVWHYGRFSEVEFKSGRVLAWSNIGAGLKVRLVPGPNVTSRPLFKLGSHKDDVVRLQGTPHSINAYRSRSGIGNYEFWSSSGGTVHFSSSDRVIDWENQDSSLKVRGIRPDRKPGETSNTGAYVGRGSSCLLPVMGLSAIVTAVPAIWLLL